MNLIAWSLTLGGALAFLAASVGLIYVIVTSNAGSAVQTSSSLHDTYYLVRQTKLAFWPMLLCMALSSSIVIVGYMHTDLFFRRVIQQQSR
jgi:hypothetical protein